MERQSQQPFQRKNMAIRIIRDGSCYHHSIMFLLIQVFCILLLLFQTSLSFQQQRCRFLHLRGRLKHQFRMIKFFQIVHDQENKKLNYGPKSNNDVIITHDS